MKWHKTKSKFFTVNINDTEPFVMSDIVISYTPEYTYSGSPVSNQPVRKQIASHITSKQCHMRKFPSLLAKNGDALFVIMKTVWDSALTSALLYSCETWLCKDVTAAHIPYITFAKEILGVRIQTSKDLVYVELNVPSVKSLIQKKDR